MAMFPPWPGLGLQGAASACRLARLATASAHQGKGFGERMLFDAIERVTWLSSEIGGSKMLLNW
jgi:GNAT superfamily N-acetyltransferase